MSVIELRTEPASPSTHLTPLRAFSIAFAFIFGLALFGLLGQVRENPRLFWSFMGAVAVLLAWSAVLFTSAWQRGRKLTLEFVPRPQHYLQACLQTAIFAYWGWYWRQVYDSYYLVIAQLIFAYAFDLLLSWSRRNSYTLGFLPFPIVFSTNLFLLFKPDWFYFQFMMLALGFAAKELIRWNKQGRDTHVFNPYIPISVFFGMHLLFTDPSTAPRTELGRMIFGALYGLGNVALYAALQRAGAPEFYDKLLPVPILNVMIQLIDRAAGSGLLRWFDPSRFGRSLVGRRRHLAYITVWATVFVLMSAVQGVGDRHPGQFVPFWEKACSVDRPYACSYLAGMHAN